MRISGGGLSGASALGMTTMWRSAARRAPARPADCASKARNTSSPMETSCISGLRPDATSGDMRAFEDFKVGDIMEFAPLAITTADIKSFAARFDPQPVHLDEAASQDTIEDGLTPSALHLVSRLLLHKT